MTPIIVEGVELLVAPVLDGFNCYDCALRDSTCVRVNRDNGVPFFEDKSNGKDPMAQGGLYCIADGIDLVFVANNPKTIAKYVAARLDRA